MCNSFIISTFTYPNEVRKMTKEEQYIQELEAKLAAKERAIEELESKILSLDMELAWLRKKLFGKMSEKHLPVDPNVLEPTLFDEMLSEEEQAELDAAVKEAEERVQKAVEVKAHTRVSRGPVFNQDLPVVEEHIYPELDEPNDYSEIGVENTDTIEIESPKLYVKRIVRHKFVLKSSLQITDPDRETFVIAPLPPMPLPKSMASSSLLADILVNKYIFHIPFHRQIEIYKKCGVSLSSSTIGDWFAAVCDKLRPLYNQLRVEVFQSRYIQMDESTLPVVDNEKHLARKGYIWVARDALTGNLFFFYEEGSRAGKIALKLLNGYCGSVQVDGYQAYEALENISRIIVLGCWAHVRRKFADALKSHKTLASEALVYINKLYEIEAKIKEQNLSVEQIKKIRLLESYKVISMFEKWCISTSMKVSKNTAIYKAISYAYSLLPRLTKYVYDGRYNIDNNLIENAIRPLALGRKNYLFCGNEEAAHRAAIVYSLFGSCKAFNIEPREWLIDILPRLTAGEDILTLMPSVWEKR